MAKGIFHPALLECLYRVRIMEAGHYMFWAIQLHSWSRNLSYLFCLATTIEHYRWLLLSDRLHPTQCHLGPLPPCHLQYLPLLLLALPLHLRPVVTIFSSFALPHTVMSDCPLSSLPHPLTRARVLLWFNLADTIPSCCLLPCTFTIQSCRYDPVLLPPALYNIYLRLRYDLAHPLERYTSRSHSYDY